MNKFVLEKLIHGHNLVDVNDPSSGLFAKHFAPAPHFSGIRAEKMNDPSVSRYSNFFDDGKDGIFCNPRVMRDHLTAMSHGISQAQKFYLPLQDASETLTDVELTKVADDVKMHLPYSNTFIQWETKDICYNLWCIDRGIVSDAENPVISAMLIPYEKENKLFYLDFSFYDMTWHNDSSYTFWLSKENNFYNWLDTDADHTGMYTNKSLNNYVQMSSDVLFHLNLMLQFPSITHTNKIKGLKPSDRPSRVEARKFKSSVLNYKPTWEHKVLKINMYENEVVNKSMSFNLRSSGTKFHSVRKHLRKLHTGKHTFVKAHFRGAKEFGNITKDYEIGGLKK